jgi:hypothetical protein
VHHDLADASLQDGVAVAGEWVDVGQLKIKRSQASPAPTLTVCTMILRMHHYKTALPLLANGLTLAN